MSSLPARETAGPGPLAGLRVIELGTLLAGPFAGRLLGDMGAEVIKVEAPGKPDPLREWGQARYRGRTLGFSLDTDSTLLSLQGNWSDAAGRFYELSLHHATIASKQANVSYVTTAPVIVNMAEARISLPLTLGGRSTHLDLAGRLQDDQPRPHNGFAAALEVALRMPLN